MDHTSGEKNPAKGTSPPEKRYRGQGLVSFLANLESIRQEVEAGWPLQAIYDHHKDRLSIQYMQFHRYVAKYIKGKEPQRRSGNASTAKDLPPSSPRKSLNDPTPLSDSELF